MHNRVLADEVVVLVRPIVKKKVFDADARDDVVQEVQIAVSKHLNKLLGKDDPRTFILAIARNKCLRHCRNQVTGDRKLVHANSEAIVTAEPSYIPEDGVEQAEEYAKLEEFIATLPPPLPTIVKLRFWKDQSFREIGEEVGLSQDRIRTLVLRFVEAAKKLV